MVTIPGDLRTADICVVGVQNKSRTEYAPLRFTCTAVRKSLYVYAMRKRYNTHPFASPLPLSYWVFFKTFSLASSCAIACLRWCVPSKPLAAFVDSNPCFQPLCCSMVCHLGKERDYPMKQCLVSLNLLASRWRHDFQCVKLFLTFTWFKQTPESLFGALLCVWLFRSSLLSGE